MNHPAFACPPDAAVVARHLLAAFRNTDLEALEVWLDQADTAPANTPKMDTGAEERWELLRSVARRMRCGMNQFSLRLTDRLEGGELCLTLLAHLAASRASSLRLTEDIENVLEFSPNLAH